MALKYVVTKQVFGFDESKTEKYVARQVASGQVSFRKLCTQVGQICGAHRGTVQLVIAGLIDALINNLDDGKSVQLGEFGTFRPGIRAKAASTEEDVSAENIYRRRIIFTPGTALKDVMNKVSITRFTAPDTDYTKSASNYDNGGGSDYGEAPDPGI
ncbi:HU family DNA-binding protein [Bacteroides sp. UBA939]|uniref:HU family DNA-binding protein n=1 Tax=Bacteroides sp. UBA939 TaxID=1946092 RepID=UPI0025C4180B|nr:HU family DNA-binding protein [Bacteroides sp. UBA939]